MYVSSLRPSAVYLPPQLINPLTPSTEAIAMALLARPELNAGGQQAAAYTTPDPAALAVNQVDVYA